jgi:hypothetical protein
MIDIYNIPFYYIGFKKNIKLEDTLKKIGFKNVNYFQAIDGRKMKPKQLLKNKIISIRAYNDLIYGREQHTGISSLGTIGCTLSHLELWKLCVEHFPYIIIAEDDLDIKSIKDKDIKNIQKSLKDPLGVFISTKLQKGHQLLFGLHLYFLTNGAAKKMVNNALPIDLQTDSYIGNLNNVDEINVTGYSIATQNNHKSTTGDNTIKVNLPVNNMYYYIICIVIVLIFIIMLIFIIYFYNKFKLCINK